ncbi:heavy-metal-associated domain-containing protein [Erythrobacter sp. F6033]|uniref:heavy-metal-associated domain-containing protein n=1 Tax=Erythrobacter sp. F6033 TaxID=2926401 RepID=UPI001FF33698|nr:heavy-metal-associated domain-containing protein [Erythrobacter sp. F6033]MCK0127854.1 heavy-metal-associated domain-containing protein [Erythrobacter sp. F6033]
MAPAWLRRFAAAIIALALLGGGYAFVLAQVSGERGIAPTASSSDVEVRGIEVDERGDNAEDAREKAWRKAQREAWSRVDGPPVSDGQLASMVSSIVIQRERIGPKRYIATLGVIFDRQRAARYLGGASTARSSAPMLLIPVTASAGAYTTFEVRNPWQRAWAEFNPGTSRIDYVRPTGAGGDSLLLTYGQTGRRSRAWWRSTLDQFGAADALTPIARLEYQFPGGPVTGTFTTRYGPDSRVLETFELTAESPAQLPAMLGQAVERMDATYEAALASGKLQPDPTLRIGGSGDLDPAIARLIEVGRAIQAREAAARAAAAAANNPAGTEQPGVPGPPPATTSNFVVQFATPDASAFDAALSGVRGAGGVRGLSVTSTAIGGTSVMSVSYAGSLDQLAAALRARGFAVNQGANALAISR